MWCSIKVFSTLMHYRFISNGHLKLSSLCIHKNKKEKQSNFLWAPPIFPHTICQAREVYLTHIQDYSYSQKKLWNTPKY